jgi:effector-binding domain-containing protein
MEVIRPPQVVSRLERTYVGKRVVTPFRGMLRVRDELLAELDAWAASKGSSPTGPAFLRLWVVDMEGPMDIEVGLLSDDPGLTAAAAADADVDPGAMPAGDYASLTYRDHSLRANRALLTWVEEEGLQLDAWDGPGGRTFGCRYETYLSDRREQPRKTQWEVELAIRLHDAG